MTLSRRAVLLGGAGVLAGCGADHRPAAVPTSRPGSVRSGTVSGTDWALVLPPGSDGRDLPVVVALGGRSQGRSYLLRTLGLPRFLAASGQGLAILAVAGGSSYWHRRDDGRDTGRLVVERLLPAVARLGVAVDRPAFLGWSMGGYGALLLASDLARAGHPVGPVAVTSPALWTSYADSAPGAFDSAADFERHDVFDRIAGLRALRLRIDIGDRDPFLRATRAFASQVGVPARVTSGGHDASYWTRTLPAQLRWLGRRA